VAIWVLTRNRPTGPRRGTTVLVMGAASLLLGAAALAFHFAITTVDVGDVGVLIVRIATILAPLGWAALTVAVHREERREHVRTHGATAGLALLGVFTTGTVLAMLPGLLDATAAVA
jgi:hypothetical protein